MEKFSFKNYPPGILVFLICLIVAIKFGLHKLGNIVFAQQVLLSWLDLLYILLSAGTVIFIMKLANRKIMWKWLLKLLDLCDVRGVYEGYIVSSFHDQDDPSQNFIKRYCKVHVTQNLNGLHISGDYYSDKQMKKPTSGFSSYQEEIKKHVDGSFQISYFYSNKGDQLHKDHETYGLNNHEGVCVLAYQIELQTLEGYYFNRERSSHGKIFLKRVS
jgi:hypothetical protein